MKKFVFLIFLFSFNAFAAGKLTSISPNLSIYSEYYPNSSAKFKGTIIFENGSGTDINEWKHNKKFFNCVKKIGSVFLYDRNGSPHAEKAAPIGHKKNIKHFFQIRSLTGVAFSQFTPSVV